MHLRHLLLLVPLLLTGCGGWRDTVDQRLPAYGHRNWICVVDAAYPLQTSPGVETVVTGTDQLAVVDAVLTAVGRQAHVRPVILVDRELAAVAEADAPGITAYRTALAARLAGLASEARPHEQIIHDLDAAGGLVRVLILKTNLTLPYTSVFIRLDCGYWTPEAEQRLRTALAAQTPGK